MNPDTGEFVPVKEMPDGLFEPVKKDAAPSPIPKDWPIFTIGDVFELKKIPFRLVRINDSTIVLRPDIHGESARKIVSKIRGRR
jgi:hypothetical protein